MYIKKFTKRILLSVLVSGIKRMYLDSVKRKLLIDEVGERSVTSCLYATMQNDFSPADLYEEYDKVHDSTGPRPKEMPELGKRKTSIDLVVFSNRIGDVRPDKLAVEIKMSYGSCSGEQLKSDIDKLKYLTSFSSKVKYRYILGCHLFLDKNFFVIVCYKEGHPYSVLKFNYDYVNHSWTDQLPQEVSEDFEYNSLAELMRHFPEDERG